MDEMLHDEVTTNVDTINSNEVSIIEETEPTEVSDEVLDEVMTEEVADMTVEEYENSPEATMEQL